MSLATGCAKCLAHRSRPYDEDMHRVLVPSEPTAEIPKGAALIEVGRGRGMMCHAPREPFAESCAQALRQGRLVELPEGCVEAGVFDEHDGELRLSHHAHGALDSWLGHRLSRSDLEARDCRSDRRARARRLTFEGRRAEAFLLDRRLGL
jgi:hypothetical protein